MYGDRRLSGKALNQRANVGRRSAHVHHDTVAHTGQEGRAAHAVGGTGRDGENGEPRGEPGVHERPVVLAHKQWGVDAQRCQGLLYPLDGPGGDVSQAGVQHCGVFPFQKAHASVFVGKANSKLGRLLGNYGRRFGLVGGVDRGEHAGYCQGPYIMVAHVADRFPQSFRVEGGNLPTIELVTATDHVGESADCFPQRVGPVHQGRQQLRGGQRQPDNGGGRQVALL